MFRPARVVLLVAAALALAAPSAASAAPAQKLSSELTALWTKVLTTPNAQNPFGAGGAASACLTVNGALAPFGPNPPGVPSCTTTTGTKIFEIGSSFECSSFEGNGTTDAELRACARASDAQVAPTVTLDGRSVPLTEVETPLMDIVLRADNIFGLPAGTRGVSVGHGWVAMLHPLPPGDHTILITGAPGPSVPPTVITVTPGRSV
jgi:hypothetical protein